MSENLIETHGIGKDFNGVWVLRDIDFTLRKGEIHALVGENGAGKSTFIKILSGIYGKSSGEVLMNGQHVNFHSPQHSEAAGIRTVHQEINLVPNFRVYENIFIGSEKYKNVAGFRVMDDAFMRRRSREVLDQLDCPLDETTISAYINTSMMKMVEISKVLVYDPSVIIFDEPTTALGENERKHLLDTICKLRDKGIAIIYISHNLEEIKSIADRVTVFRDGKKVAELSHDEIEIETIIKHMLGNKTYNSYVRNETYAEDEVVLKLDNVCTDKLKNVSFSAKKGEIVGFAGVIGAGKTEVARAIFGLDKLNSGSISYLDRDYATMNIDQAISQGIALVPEERQAQGIIPNYSITKNITLSYMKQWSPNSVFNNKEELATAHEYIERMSIKTQGPSQMIKYLSGGNQQKVILSRWMSGHFKLGIFDEPTKGIDIKAKEDIYILMDKLAKSGKTILMMSSYLPELLCVCDRIVVMREGKIMGEFDPKSQNAEEKITAVMLGGNI